MARVKNAEGEREVSDGGHIKQACEELGVVFGCEEGLCGSCDIHVLEGMENLNEINQQEEDLALEEGHRLACQCKLKQGEIKFEF